jgi:hypothetical protein
VVEEAQSILLEKGSGWRLRATAPEADEISLDLTFPRGLVRFDEKGGRQERTVQVQVQSRLGADPGPIAARSPSRPARRAPCAAGCASPSRAASTRYACAG